MAVSCEGCRSGEPLGFDFTMAFQPIVDAAGNSVWGYEALIRGTGGEGAGEILSRVTPEQRYRFDQACRVKAIELAARIFPKENTPRLSINFLPNAVYSPLACIQLTLATAREVGFPTERLIFELTENEQIDDADHVRRIVDTYQQMGFGTAMDDFGAGHAGLGLLARIQTDYLKLDMELVREIDRSKPKRIIVEGVVRIAKRLGITVIAEGIETLAEAQTLHLLGIRYLQGFYFARPAFRALPEIEASTRLRDAA